jgi:hypothetical protein
MNGITTPWQGHKILDDDNIWEHSSEAAIVCGYYLQGLIAISDGEDESNGKSHVEGKMWHWDWVGCQQHFYGWY